MAAAESPAASATPKWTWFDATLDDARQPRKTVPITNDPAQSPELAVLLGMDEKNPSPSTIHAASRSQDELGDEGENHPEPVLETEEDPGLVVATRQSTRQAIAQHPLVRESRDYVVVAFARMKPAVTHTWQRFVAFAKSQQWDRNLDSLLRWLQQPLPPLKVHRRAGD